jgi:hypothetical protein
MSITFPTFIDKEIVTPEKLNDFVSALESKFTSGLTSAEIQWPLVASGDLVMGDNAITGGTSIWGIYNAAQYEDDWDSCLTAGAGGCIVIPPNTTITMDAADMTGSSLTIKGSGPTSILQLEVGATGGYALQNTAAGFSLKLENLTVDGASVAASDGVLLRGVTRCSIDRVYFKNFTQSPLKLSGYSSAPCSELQITDCYFEGGSGYHIEGNSVGDLVIKGCVFDTAAKTAVNLEAASATSLMRVNISDNVFKSCVGNVIEVIGYDGNYNAGQDHVVVKGNIANNGNGIIVGDATHKLQHVVVADNIVPSATADALNVCAKYGTISDNVMPGAGADGLDLHVSEDVVVRGNSFRDATAAGVRSTSALDCTIAGNDCVDCRTSVIISTSATRPSYHYDNSNTDPEALPVNTWYTNGATVTIPANTLRVGDVLSIQAVWTDGGAGTQGVQLDGNYVVSFSAAGTTDEVGAIAQVIVDGTTTMKAIGSCWADGGTNGNSGGPGLTGKDLTSDIDIKINGATISNEELFVSIKRGVVV